MRFFLCGCMPATKCFVTSFMLAGHVYLSSTYRNRFTRCAAAIAAEENFFSYSNNGKKVYSVSVLCFVEFETFSLLSFGSISLSSTASINVCTDTNIRNALTHKQPSLHFLPYISFVQASNMVVDVVVVVVFWIW